MQILLIGGGCPLKCTTKISTTRRIIRASETMTDMYDEKKVPGFSLPPYPHEEHGSEVRCYFFAIHA
jgi:hypothetical protein